MCVHEVVFFGLQKPIQPPQAAEVGTRTYLT
jgi:hypothetical protein